VRKPNFAPLPLLGSQSRASIRGFPSSILFSASLASFWHVAVEKTGSRFYRHPACKPLQKVTVRSNHRCDNGHRLSGMQAEGVEALWRHSERCATTSCARCGAFAALIQLLVSYFPPGHYRGNKQRTSSPNQAQIKPKSSRNASSFQNGN
jgi:hypothetical protein